MEALLSWTGLSWVKVLGAVLAAGALFGAGYYTAVRGQQKATAAVVVQSVHAQAKKDDKDYKAGQQDSQKRQEASGAAEVRYRTIYRDRVQYVHDAPGCVVPAASFDALNDPALIGDTP